MDVPDKPTDRKDVELTEVDEKPPPEKSNNEKQQQPIGGINITFCTHVGWYGVLICFISLGVAGLFTYIAFLYTKGFRALHRPFVWLLIVEAVLYVLLVLTWGCRWRKVAKRFTEQQEAEQTQNHEQRLLRSSSALEQLKVAASVTKRIYENFEVNGIWFLWKLYIFEVFESAYQSYNLVTIYLCSIPVAWTSFMCLGLAAGCFFAGWTMTRKNTPERRDKQIQIDAVIDFFCVTTPLSVLWFVYEVPISVLDIIFITFLPSLFLLVKLNDLLDEGIHYRSAQQVLREQKNLSFKVKRRRESMFQQVAHLNMAELQEEKVPRPMRWLAAGCEALFGTFFLVVAVVHMVTNPTGCDFVVWEKGCVNKIPFCKTLFEPTCNCASLQIQNDYGLVALPDSLPDEMNGLRKVLIHNCNLTKLPPRMEQLTEMADFRISFNRLEEFMVNILKWEKLQTIYLNHNNIQRLNEEAIWNHKEMVNLELSNNSISIPDGGIYLPSLNYLHLGDNNMSLNIPFEAGTFPNIISLFVNGNDLIHFPYESLGYSLQHLGVARCNLNSIPSYVSKFGNLLYLDARDNKITRVDGDLKKLIKKNDIESYFSGNQVCSTDSSLDCEPLCSKTCWSRNVINDGICDLSCRTKRCDFDGGDCDSLQ